MTTAAPRWALVLLVSLSAGAAADRSSPGAQPPRLLSGGEQLEALVLATEAEALRRAIDSPAWAQERLHVCTRQLEDLLDDGGTTSRDPNELRRSLAASVAAADAPAPSVKTRLARVLTLVNIAWFCGALLIAVAAAALLGAYAAALVMLVPLPAWEAAGYLLSIWVLRAATRAVPSAAPYLALTGLMLLTACMGSSIALHDLARRFEAHKEAATSALLALLSSLYGAAAVRLQAPLLGTLSVWWAMAALGFFVAVLPFCTLVGFRSGMARPFAAALLLILAFLPFKAAPAALPMPAALRPFESGVWLWCTLVLNLANLIDADRAWQRGDAQRLPPPDVLAQLPRRVLARLLARWAAAYLLAQVPALAVIGGTLACGIVLDIEQCRGVGAVFGFLWLFTKLAEFDWKRVGLAWAALAFGCVLWGSAYAVHAWPHMFGLAGA